MNFKIKCLFIFILFLLILFFSVIFSIININNSNILNYIYINNIDMSGLSKNQAYEKLSQSIEKKFENQIKISSDFFDESLISFDSLDISYDISSSIDEAYSIGRNSNIFKNNFEILNLIINKKFLTLNVNLNEEKIDILLNNLSSNLENPFVESDYYIEDNSLIVTNSKSGNIIDDNKFKSDLKSVTNDLSSFDNIIKTNIYYKEALKINIDSIYSEICKDPTDAHYDKEPFKVYPEIIGISFNKEDALSLINNNPDNSEYVLALEYTYPKISIKDLNIDIFKNELSSFQTKYNVSNQDRQTNLELAAKKIDGIILPSGAIFSYNKTVGARTISAGYKEAKIYSNGKVVDGIGGGICQISSTLYNAAVLANLDIKERHNHQFITSYVPVGRDATVVYGSKDLQFINNRSYPIKINMKALNGIVTCSISGLYEEKEYSVDFITETLSIIDQPIKYEIDDSLSFNTEQVKQSGAPGYIVNTYKIIKDDGNIISKELLSYDKYIPMEKIILKSNS